MAFDLNKFPPKKWICLPLLLIVLQAFAQEMPKPFQEYADCEESDCEERYLAARDYAESVQPKTASAKLFLELAQVRKDMGVWDEEVQNLFVRAIEIYDEAGDDCGKAEAVRARSAFHLTSEEGDLGMNLAREALDLAKACGDERLLAIVYATLGVAQQNAGEYAEAIESHTAELRLYEKLGDVEMQAVSNQEMAYIYASMGDVDRANAIMLESAKLFKEIGAEVRYAACITDLCGNYLEQGRPDSVLKRLPEAIAIYRKEEYALGIAISVYNLGDAYLQKGDYQKAMTLYDEASVLCADLDFPRFLMEIEISRAQCYANMGDHAKAYSRILAAEKLAEETSNFEGLLNIYRQKMSVAHKAGKHQDSFEAAVNYIDLKDSLRSIARDEKVAAMQEMLEAEKREKEIAVLERENELESQKKNGLILIIGLVILGSGVALNREVQRRKKSKQLHEAEIRVKEADEKLLREELAFKKRELATKALHISQKNEVLENLRGELQKLAGDEEADRSVREVLNQLRIERSIDGNWEEFTRQFQDVNPDFYQRLSERAPEMTKSELRLAALLRMNLSSKEIASVLNISHEGVKKARHRFRKKLELETEENLEQFILNL